MRALVCAGALCGAIVAVVPAAARTGANAGSTVFVTTGVSHWASGDVFVVDGSGPRRNVTRTPGESERDPDWSPDGSELAFARGRAETSDVYVRDAGGAERRLTTTPEREERPVWSPDGTLHAFVRVVEGRPRLWVTRRDGSGQRPLSEPTYELLTVSWSHDGKRIAFVAGRDVRVADVARGGEKQVTTQGGAVVAASCSRTAGSRSSRNAPDRAGGS